MAGWLALAPAGCASVGNVRVYAGAVLETEAAGVAVTEDLVPSCLRAAESRALSRMLVVETLPEAERAGAKQTVVAEHARTREACEVGRPLSALYRDAHRVLIGYAMALERLDGGQPIDFDDEIVRIGEGGAAVAGERIDPQTAERTAKAVSGVGKAVAAFVTRRCRERAVTQAIASAGADVEVLLGGLQRLVAEVYAPSLEDEARALTGLSAGLGQQPSMAVGVSSAFVEGALARDLQRRRAIADELGARLERLGSAHARVRQLAATRKLGARELVPEVKALVADVLGATGVEVPPLSPPSLLAPQAPAPPSGAPP